MKLYRGDTFNNDKTKPFLFRNNGLRTKAFGSGSDPENINNNKLLDLVRKHINAKNKEDRRYYEVTDFLSFSESKKRALYWASSKDSVKLVEAKDYDETRYVFELEIDNDDLKEISQGTYLFKYKCNPRLRTSDSGIFNPILDLIYKTEICEVCINKHKNHQLILINSFQFLMDKVPNQDDYKKEIKFAKQDEEWLVLPLDKLYPSFSSRIQRADFWHANIYKVENENRKCLYYL